jgi:hypothetical protein
MDYKYHGKTYSTVAKPYKNFMEALIRRKVEAPGIHATLYFDAFWLDSVVINKDAILNRKLINGIKTGSFTTWRDAQKALGLLDWMEIPGRNGVKYIPGPITLKYLNALTIESAQLATRFDIDASEDKILKVTGDLQKQIDEMQGMLKVVANHYFAKNPPHNEERESKLNENLKHGKAYLEEDQPLN